MSRSILLLCAVVSLAACGIQRPLMRPSDIPAYELKRQQKLEKRQQNMDDFERQQQIERNRLEVPQV